MIEGKMQFNFITKMSKTKYGINHMLKDINEVLLLSIDQVLREKRHSFDSIIGIQLRNLLFERNIEYIDTNIKLREFNGNYIEAKTTDEDTIYFLGTDIFAESSRMISLEEWLQQKLIYIQRLNDNVPEDIDKETFQNILDRIKSKNDKTFFTNSYYSANYSFKGESMEGFLLSDLLLDDVKERLWNILNEVGYNYITVSEYIKLIADKTGAHLDTEWPIGLMMIHKNENVNYILQLGIYIAGILTDYLKQEGMFSC